MEFIYSKETQDLIDKFENLKKGFINAPKMIEFINNQLIKIRMIAIPMILIKEER